VNLYTYVGLVTGESVELLLAEDGTSGTCRLSRAAADAAPEQNALDLRESDGLIVLIRGIRRGDWICSAVVVERATELQSIVAQAALGRKPRFPGG
jgi:hypothetical protein